MQLISYNWVNDWPLLQQARDLGLSGYQIVYAQTLFAIIGALALEKGGEIANRITRERILKPLGLDS